MSENESHDDNELAEARKTIKIQASTIQSLMISNMALRQLREQQAKTIQQLRQEV